MAGRMANRLFESVMACSQSEIVELTYEYIVPDCNQLIQQTGECIFSPVFHAKSQPTIQWRLRIYPKGSKNSKGHLGLFLERVNMTAKDQPVIVKLKFTILRNEKPVSFIWSVSHSIASQHEGLGWNDLVSQEQLRSDTSNKQKIELKVVCHLVCEVQRNWITSYARTAEKICVHSEEQQTFIELNYEWVIEEPSFLPQKNGESFYSPIFFAKANYKIRWRLRICPKGANEECEDHFSLYLERFLASNDQSVSVEVRLTVSKNGKLAFGQSGIQLEMGRDPLLSCWGWDKLAKLSSLRLDYESQRVGYVPDELRITCQLVYTI